MAEKEGIFQAEGVVVASLRDAMFRVKLDNDYELIAHTSGRIRKSRIRILVGDRVAVDISAHGVSAGVLGKGRITKRLKETDERPTTI